MQKKSKKTINEEVESIFKDAQHRGWRKPRVTKFKYSLWRPHGRLIE